MCRFEYGVRYKKMKKVKLIGLLAVLMNLTACGQTQENKTQKVVLDGWKSLTENNYSINYPDNWRLDKSGQMGTSFILFSPFSSEQDQFSENINLLIFDLTGQNIDLNKYVEISESKIATIITDGKIIQSKRMTNGSLNYQKVIYTGKEGVFNFKFEQYYWIENDKAYVLTLTCEEDQFDIYETQGEMILNSFNLDGT